MTLSILCITQLEDHALPFLAMMDNLSYVLNAEFVLAVDTDRDVSAFPHAKVVRVHSKGYLESVLDEAIGACQGEYILRLDDDECCSPAMVDWLMNEQFLAYDHWHFPRAHLWPDAHSMILTSPLWPDNQVRLSTKAKAGGRENRPHAMPVFGMGEGAPVILEHHKFLVKSYAERQAIAAKWHTGIMTIFSLPEDAVGVVDVVETGNGSLAWNPSWHRRMEMRATV